MAAPWMVEAWEDAEHQPGWLQNPETLDQRRADIEDVLKRVLRDDCLHRLIRERDLFAKTLDEVVSAASLGGEEAGRLECCVVDVDPVRKRGPVHLRM